MTDRVMRDGAFGPPIVDDDGNPITEIDVDNVDDALAGADASLQQLATAQQTWRFGHVIVDEAQDLTPMQWRMVARRARGGSMTLVGDLAQRSIGEPGTWAEHLPESLGDFAYQELSVNYRSPAEVGDMAAAVLAELAPGLRQPMSIRHAVNPPQRVRLPAIEELGDLVTGVREQTDGSVAVIGAEEAEQCDLEGVRWLTPWQAKGLEFDAVIVVEPRRIVALDGGLSLLFVALTRTTDRLVIAHAGELPRPLARYFDH